MYSIVFSSASRKELKKLPREVLKRVVQKIEELSENPYSPYLDIKKLAGSMDEYRLRVGDYRIIYSIENNKLYIFVITIAHRKDVYK